MPKQRFIETVFFCFYTPKDSQPHDSLSRLVTWGVRFFQEKYTHVECLFKLDGLPTNPDSWHALSVAEKTGSGLFVSKVEYYRGSRWAILRLTGVTDAEKASLYKFAMAERGRTRTYNYGAVINTAPYGISYCAPVVRYSPCCYKCVPTGNNTVYCVQLMMEMLQSVWPDKFALVRADSLRPDQFLSILVQNFEHRYVALEVDSGHSQAFQTSLMSIARPS